MAVLSPALAFGSYFLLDSELLKDGDLPDSYARSRRLVCHPGHQRPYWSSESGKGDMNKKPGTPVMTPMEGLHVTGLREFLVS